MGWTRETKWAQGALLTGQSLAELHPEARSDSVAVAISHSCDISNDSLEAEPVVEFVVGRPLTTCDGNYSHAKNPRKLHLPIWLNAEFRAMELEANKKFSVPKSDLYRHQPDEERRLNPADVEVLQAWLAARYQRQALPDALVKRLKPLFDKMEKLGGKHSQAILGYWFDFDPREELPPEAPYEVSVSVVYSVDDAVFETHAHSIAKSLDEIRNLAGIEPLRCAAYSGEEFTLKDLRQHVRYRAEHLSYRTQPHGPTV